MRPLILASGSPRRHELLTRSGLAFTVVNPNIPEDPEPGEKARALVLRLSQAKARAAAATLTPTGTETDPIIIAADTTVAIYDNSQTGFVETMLAKPADAAEARRMLTQLRNRNHSVLTGFTLLDTASGREEQEAIMAWVPMRNYSDAEIEAYVASGDPLDKAGAYAIQYSGFQPVNLAKFTDCYANVMGLPVCAVMRHLRDWGVLPGEKGTIINGLRTGDCRHAAVRPAPLACPITGPSEAAHRG